jgi:hypothetical protein
LKDGKWDEAAREACRGISAAKKEKREDPTIEEDALLERLYAIRSEAYYEIRSYECALADVDTWRGFTGCCYDLGAIRIHILCTLSPAMEERGTVIDPFAKRVADARCLVGTCRDRAANDAQRLRMCSELHNIIDCVEQERRDKEEALQATLTRRRANKRKRSGEEDGCGEEEGCGEG